MVTSLISRLGAVGLSLVAGALIFGAVAGGVVVHRLEFPASRNAASEQQQGDNQAGESEKDNSQTGQNEDQPKPTPTGSKKATNPSPPTGQQQTGEHEGND